MNNKRILALAAALCVMSANVAFAEYDPNKVIDTSVPYTTLSLTAPEAPAAFGGAVADAICVQEVNGITMMPLRSVAETLGYTVNWIGETKTIELTRGAQFITMSIDNDSYAFSRRAPQTLGAAPTLVGDVTYVPVSFATEIIDGSYSVNEDGTYKVVLSNLATVLEVNSENSILVEDDYLGEVVVFVTEETQITKGLDRRIYKIDDLTKGARLEIEYSAAMAQSLPPQASAVKINIVEMGEEKEEAEEAVSLSVSGAITEITEDGMVIVESEERGEVALIVTDETVITKGLDRRIYKIDDLEVGMKITAEHEEQMTFSLPPQTAALTIAIEN